MSRCGSVVKVIDSYLGDADVIPVKVCMMMRWLQSEHLIEIPSMLQEKSHITGGHVKGGHVGPTSQVGTSQVGMLETSNKKCITLK